MKDSILLSLMMEAKLSSRLVQGNCQAWQLEIGNLDSKGSHLLLIPKIDSFVQSTSKISPVSSQVVSGDSTIKSKVKL